MSYPNLGPMRPIVNVHWPTSVKRRSIAVLLWSRSRKISDHEACFPPSASWPCGGTELGSDYQENYLERLTISYIPGGSTGWPTPPAPFTFGAFEVPYYDPFPEALQITALHGGGVVDHPPPNVDNPGEWKSSTTVLLKVDLLKQYGTEFCNHHFGFNYRRARCIEEGATEICEFTVNLSNIRATNLDGSVMAPIATMTQVPPSVPDEIYILLEQED